MTDATAPTDRPVATLDDPAVPAPEDPGVPSDPPPRPGRPPRHPHPTSARARAALRRRRRGGALAVAGRAPRWWRRRPARPPLTGHQLRRRRTLLVAALATTAVTGVGLSTAGVHLVRNSTAGRYVAPPARPDEPGYQAYVVPTPTMAVLQEAQGEGLVAATLLSLLPSDEGGTVLLVPPATRSGDGGDDAETLAEAYADGGAEAAVTALEDVLGVAVDGHIVLDEEGWAALASPVAPVAVELEAPVAYWPAGEVALIADDVGTFLAVLAPDESELDRIGRQAAFWGAWLGEVADGGSDAVPGEADVGIGRFVRGLAPEHTTAVLPVTAAGDDDATTYAPDEERVSDVIATAVPYPLSPAPGRRVRVRLLNGTDDPDLTAAVASLLVEAGAEITIVGNADSFSVPQTTVAYRSARERTDARELAEALGVGRVERDADAPSTEPTVAGEGAGEGEDGADEIDVTIILGSDAQDLIGRLENAG